METVKIVTKSKQDREGAKSGAMPVKWLMQWKISNLDKKLSEDILSELLRSIRRMYAVDEGPWKNTLTFIHPVLKDRTRTTKCALEFNGLSLYEDPQKYFFVMFPPKLVVEVDSNYSLIMEHLGSYKKGVSCQFEGTRYRCGDFQFRLGFVTVPSQSRRIRGILMEIEYLPTSSIETAKLIMEEFVSLLNVLLSQTKVQGYFMYHDPKYTEFGLPDEYSSRHTAVQYSYLMTSLVCT